MAHGKARKPLLTRFQPVEKYVLTHESGSTGQSRLGFRCEKSVQDSKSSKIGGICA